MACLGFQTCLLFVFAADVGQDVTRNLTNMITLWQGFEMVRKLILDTHEFCIEDDTLTPTFKLKRPQLQKRYQQQIDAYYKGSQGAVANGK